MDGENGLEGLETGQPEQKMDEYGERKNKKLVYQQNIPWMEQA